MINDLYKKGEYGKVLEDASLLFSKGILSETDAKIAFRAAIELKDDDMQRLWLERALRMQPEDPWLLYHKSRMLLTSEKFPEAVKVLEFILSRQEDNATCWAALSHALHKLGKLDKAIECLERAIAIKPDIYAYYNRIVSILFLSNKLESARKYCTMIPEDKMTLTVRALCKELNARKIKSRGELSSIYYDDIYKDSESYKKSSEDSTYAPLWDRVCKEIKRGGFSSILDLGCGPGQFAEHVRLRLPEVKYCGVDFSRVAIDAAQNKNPDFLFIKDSLPLKDYRRFPFFDVVVCLEVLEHVDNDIGILSSIPHGKYIIASVPNFDSFGHVRFFIEKNKVIDRYEKFFENINILSISFGKNNKIWIFHGFRSKP